MKNQYSTNKVSSFNVVFDNKNKQDVFVTEKQGRAEDVARELNLGVSLEDVLVKYGVTEK